MEGKKIQRLTERKVMISTPHEVHANKKKNNLRAVQDAILYNIRKSSVFRSFICTELNYRVDGNNSLNQGRKLRFPGRQCH